MCPMSRSFAKFFVHQVAGRKLQATLKGFTLALDKGDGPVLRQGKQSPEGRSSCACGSAVGNRLGNFCVNKKQRVLVLKCPAVLSFG